MQHDSSRANGPPCHPVATSLLGQPSQSSQTRIREDSHAIDLDIHIALVHSFATRRNLVAATVWLDVAHLDISRPTGHAWASPKHPFMIGSLVISRDNYA